MVSLSKGFTLIELVCVIAVLGILAVTIASRMDNIDAQAATFHDQTVSALRYAQKTATSHRRVVCLNFTASTVAVTIAQASGSAAACLTALPLPGNQSNVLSSPNTAKAVFNPVPAGFNFLPDGTTAANRTLSITSQSNIVVVGNTGYVQ